MNQPQFKINGQERRALKKELAQLKSFVKNFWYFQRLEKDLVSIYGGGENYPMSDEIAQKKFDDAALKVKKLEEILSIPF